MSPAPGPLRALIAWPRSHASALGRGLKAAGAEVTETDDLAGYLKVGGYYHIAYAGLDEWRAFSAAKRSALGGRVLVVALGPGPATAADCAGVPACLRMPAPLPPDEVTAVFMVAHRLLAQGWAFREVAEQSEGRLAFEGAEPLWPPPQAEPSSVPPRAPRGLAVVERAGGAPGRGGTQIIVKGDLVQGDKTVHHADGDQINLNRGIPGAAKIEQTAGGDQTNLNRTAAPRDPARDACRHCGEPLAESAKFCGKCGAAR